MPGPADRPTQLSLPLASTALIVHPGKAAFLQKLLGVFGQGSQAQRTLDSFGDSWDPFVFE